MICVSYTRSRIKFGESITISEQNDKIAEFVKGRRLTVDKKYSDRKEDINADEGFLEMKEAGINRQFNCVVFWSMMHFGSDPLVGYNLLLHTFIPAGIDFAVVCDNFFSMGHSAEEIEKYLGSKYKERRLTHGKNIARIAADKRRNTLYGYEKHGEEFAIDKEAEPIVNELFQLALKGTSVSDICRHFNTKKIDCPQIYLRKIADAKTDNAIDHWERTQVKKILTDTRYKGERVVTKNGITMVKSIEPYITPEEYDTIQGYHRHYKAKSRTANPFSKMIYDKNSHIRLYMGDYMSNGVSSYYLSKKTPEYEQYKKKAIPVQDVIDEAKKLLINEASTAKHVHEVLKSTSGQAEILSQKECIMNDINAKLKLLLSSVDIAITPSSGLTIANEVHDIDSEFSHLLSLKQRIETAYSLSNPWVKLYSSLDSVNELTLDFCKRYVCEILIERFESIILVPKHNEWKQLLPSYWLEV